MQGTLRWMQVSQDTNKFQYEVSNRDIDTEDTSIRDTIVDLLLNEWDSFGEPGDCLLVVENTEED